MNKKISVTANTVAIKLSTNRVEILFSTLLGFTLLVGSVLSAHPDVDTTPLDPRTLAAYSFGFITLWVAIFLILKLIKNNVTSSKGSRRENFLTNISDFKFWALTSVGIFFCYIPIILLSFSVLTPDSWNSMGQIAGKLPLSNTHPILFTGFIAIFVKLGQHLNSVSLGILLFSFAQSAAMAMIFASIITWLRNRGVGKVMLLLVFLFYAILPVNAIAGIIMWKDILFAGFGLLFLLALRKVYTDGDKFFTKRSVCFFVIVSFLFCTWRSNGLYAYIITSVLILIISWKTYSKPKYLLLLFSPIALFIIYSSLITLISSPSSKVVMLSVPLQQIARTVKYHGNSISNEDRKTINEVLPVERLSKEYNPNLSDPIMWTFNEVAFKENEGRYATLWWRLLKQHKRTYVAAFLYNSYGYTYPFFSSPTTTDLLLDNASHYNAPDGYVDGEYDHSGKLVVAEYRDRLNSVVPLSRNIGFYFFVIIISLYVAIVRKRKELVGVYIALFCIFLTTILGPVNGEFRYLYLFVVSVPFIMGSILTNNEPEGLKKKHG